ncbi:MAG: DUF4920 domain-containing protein [Erysipelotrichia bacterium]|nr:DUF4920 domain-containing protein [Erysipelotrichia bacterium]
MKKILVLSVTLMVGIFFWLNQAGTSGTHYGDSFAANVQVVQMKDLYGSIEEHLNSPVAISGKITRQCPVSGCWFFLDDGSGRPVKVELGHMGIKFPQWSGKSVKVEGRLLQNKEGLELVGNAAEFF